MTEIELHNYLKQNFPQENEKCEWKELQNLISEWIIFRNK